MDKLKCLTFNKLPKDSIQIRTTVFVVEQGFREEFDTVDHVATHFVVYQNDKALGTARIYYSEEHKSYSLGRFAVLKEYRGQGVGAYLMNEIEQYIVEHFGHIVLGLSS